MATYFVRTEEGDVIAEIEADSPFVAACGAMADAAPCGSIMVELGSGVVVAVRQRIAGNLIGWSFCQSLEFPEERPTDRRCVA